MTAGTVVRRGEGRDVLLAAAITLIGNHGLHAVRMREIADAAGLSLGSVTYHFADRDEAILAALTAHTERVERRCARGRSRPELAGEPVAAALVREFVAVTTVPRYPAIAAEIYAEARRNRAVASLRDRCVAARRSLLYDACEELGHNPEMTVWLTRRLLAIADGMTAADPLNPNLASDIIATIFAELELTT